MRSPKLLVARPNVVDRVSVVPVTLYSVVFSPLMLSRFRIPLNDQFRASAPVKPSTQSAIPFVSQTPLVTSRCR